MTLNDSIDTWISDSSLSEAYSHSIRRSFNNYVVAVIGNKDTDKITRDDLVKIIAYMNDLGRDPYTIHTFCKILRRFFNYLLNQGMINEIPYTEDLDPQVPEHHFQTFTEDEESRIKAAIPNIPLKSIYSFCMTTGIKGSTARSIRRCDVHPEAQQIYVRYSLSNNRMVPDLLKTPHVYKLDKAVFSDLTTEPGDSGYLFPGKDGKPISPTEISKNNHMLSLLTGIPDLTLNHIAMHTAHKSAHIIR